VLRRRRTVRRLRPVLLATMVAVPLLSAGGFVSMTRELAPRAPVERPAPDVARVAELAGWRDGLKAGYVVLVLTALGIGLARAARARTAPPRG
jgi:adenylate cyclase